MSSTWKTQETQASAPTVTQSQNSESSIPPPAAAAAAGSPTSTTDSSTLVSPVAGPTGSATAPDTSTPTTDTSTLTAAVAVLPGSSAPNTQTLGAPNGSSSEQPRDSVQAKFVSSAGYVVPAPSFSYNVFPRVNSAAGSNQQSASTPVSLPPFVSRYLLSTFFIRPYVSDPLKVIYMQALKLTPPMPAAALQPPVPGQPFGNRPSFSYNVFLHANPSPASTQQFRPATVILMGLLHFSHCL